MKLMISLGIIVFSTVFGWIGTKIGSGGWLGVWSLGLSVIGAFFGIWAGFKAGKYFFG